MWHAEWVPLSSDWWLKLLPSCRPENTWILEVACKLLRCGRDGDSAELRAAAVEEIPTFATYSYSGACHCTTSSGRECNAFIKKSNSGASQQFLWIIHCNLWKHNPCCLCGCNWFVYENSHCSQKCERQPNHWTASSGSHCSMNAMKPKPADHPSLQTKPLLKASKANWATTMFMLKTASFPPLLYYCHLAHS